MRLLPLGMAICLCGCSLATSEQDTGDNLGSDFVEHVDRDSARSGVAANVGSQSPTAEAVVSEQPTDTPASVPVTREVLIGKWRTEVVFPRGTYTLEYEFNEVGQCTVDSSITDGNKLPSTWRLEKNADNSCVVRLDDLPAGLNHLGETVATKGSDTLVVTYDDGTVAEFHRVGTASKQPTE